MIYLACFAASGFFAYLAKRTQRRHWFILFSVISILIPVMLAGLRDFSIGIDVESYLHKDYYWIGARDREPLDYFLFYANQNRRDVLFVTLLILLTRITSDFRIFLFVSHAIIMTGIYIGAFRMRKQVDPVMVLLLFFLFFFNQSLNIIRQHMAMAVIFAAFKDVLDRKYLRYCIVVAIMAMVHSAAVLAFTVPLLHCFLYGNTPDGGFQLGKFTCLGQKRLPMRMRKLLIAMVLAAVMFNFVPLCYFLINRGFISDKYLYYLDKERTSYAAIITILLAAEMVVIHIFRAPMREKCPNYDFLTTGTAVYLLLLQLTAFIHSSRRIAMFYCLQNLLTIAYLAEAVPAKTKNQRLLVKAAILCVGLAYWTYFYVLRNASETFPYLSVFSG